MGRNQPVQVLAVAGALGAEVVGVDLARCPDAAFEAVRAAFRDHQVVFFRDQELSPEAQLALTRRFGALCDVPHASRRLAGYPDILEVVSKSVSGNARNVGGSWHTDMPFLEQPPAHSILYARETPDHGGDTQWASLSAAYEALSEGFQATLRGLRAVHSATRVAGSRMPGRNTREVQPPAEVMDREVTHPLVRTHIESGRRCLFVNRSTFLRFAGWSEAESAPLHEYLCQHVVRAEFTCRFRWTPGAVAIWDNRCTQHYAIDDYGPGVRRMHRTTVLGERPA